MLEIWSFWNISLHHGQIMCLLKQQFNFTLKRKYLFWWPILSQITVLMSLLRFSIYFIHIYSVSSHGLWYVQWIRLRAELEGIVCFLTLTSDPKESFIRDKCNHLHNKPSGKHCCIFYFACPTHFISPAYLLLLVPLILTPHICQLT